MSPHRQKEYFRIMPARYQRAHADQKTDLLNAVCHVCGDPRTHAIRTFNPPWLEEPRPHEISHFVRNDNGARTTTGRN